MQLDSEAKQQLQERFNFISLLGRGSFGCVYECQDKKDGQIYAVKIISKNNVKKSKMECLREEARLLSSIQHQNIVKVYEFVETNTCIFLRMEIIRNGTLENLIKKRWKSGQKFTDEEMATIICSIFKSINHIHCHNIIHRDIKPQNILIPDENKLNQLKMADFGLSTKLDFYYPKTATSKCGTMLYMAPEILNNLSYSKSVDIWSCCIIMYMLATGKHPFYQSKMTTDEYKNKIKKIVFPTLSNKLAQDFLCRISKVDPNERYTTQQALKHPWLTRNFEDEIPLSLHESFLGFQKSHSITNVEMFQCKLFKLMIVIKNTCNSNKSAIPQSYLSKKDQHIKEQLSLNLNLKKNKSIKSPLNSKSLVNTISHKDCQKQNGQKQKSQRHMDNDNPTILKLNKIFDSLFDRKNKTKEKFYTENTFNQTKSKEFFTTVPNQISHKEKIQIEIQRIVREFKNSDYGKASQTLRRILPENKRHHSDRFQTENQEVKIIADQHSNSTHRIRYRKKFGSTLRYYD